jgi:hypothetical protein
MHFLILSMPLSVANALAQLVTEDAPAAHISDPS